MPIHSPEAGGQLPPVIRGAEVTLLIPGSSQSDDELHTYVVRWLGEELPGPAVSVNQPNIFTRTPVRLLTIVFGTLNGSNRVQDPTEPYYPVTRDPDGTYHMLSHTALCNLQALEAVEVAEAEQSQNGHHASANEEGNGSVLGHQTEGPVGITIT